jgi:hypothetical protein
LPSPLSRLRYARRRRARRREAAELPEGRAEPLTFEDDPSQTLLVVFGGLNRQVGGVPPFEFMRLTGGVPVKRLFVRDPRQAWYHRGLPGIGDDLDAVVTHLAARPYGGYGRLVAVGNSAGGYAALLLGSLLEADCVLAFAPQTTIDLAELHRLGDRRWDDNLEPLAARGLLDPRFVDLRGLAYRDARVYFDAADALDRGHAERLLGDGAAGLRGQACEGGGHDLVRTLRDRGTLTEILRSALQV